MPLLQTGGCPGRFRGRDGGEGGGAGGEVRSISLEFSDEGHRFDPAQRIQPAIRVEQFGRFAEFEYPVQIETLFFLLRKLQLVGREIDRCEFAQLGGLYFDIAVRAVQVSGEDVKSGPIAVVPGNPFDLIGQVIFAVVQQPPFFVFQDEFLAQVAPDES